MASVDRKCAATIKQGIDWQELTCMLRNIIFWDGS